MDASGPWEGQNKRFALNAATGAVQEIPLYSYDNGGIRPVEICGRTSDGLLVRVEGREWERTEIGSGGTPALATGVENYYGLISAEDFLAGQANYRELTTHYIQEMFCD